MSKIKDIFVKPIDRNIRGVIKIGQDDESIKENELSEYVVTDELKRDFIKFFDSYNKSIDKPTDEMGVWISGFFGSGKSHFLKILSYLLENDTVKNRRAIDYFLEDGKFDDNHLTEAINKATSVPTDVALFNIDSKADSNSSNDNSAILTVFLKVFNEQLGYSSIPEVAAMERWLDSENKYDAFKAAFQELDSENHTTWIEARSKYAILTTRIQKTLVNANILNEEDAKNYVEHLQLNKYSISPEEFADLVKDYLDKKGNNYHFVFLADEVGQFIGDNDKRMLNLQTIVEQLGVKCQGRAWVIVTSQQQMNQVTEGFTKHERDFSKIQSRFNTMINMSSANADEVIRKRLLAKRPLASEQLQNLFTQKEFSINNKINFSDQIKRQKFNDSEEFVDNYPFIPYQFSLLKDVLAVVRKKGASGSHMSDGERSMLATFQEATKNYEDSEVGALVPFAAFFTGMKEFLNHDHQVVFDKAIGDKYINPNNENYPFIIQILAVLFMIKYVDNYPATLDNITTLLLNNIDQDRVELTAQVKDALNILKRQNYVQQKLDTYDFLTDSEQEVNESINAIEVDDHKVVKRIGSYLLSDGLVDPKYNYNGCKMKNQYIFEFNMYIDGSGLNRLTNDLNIKVVSPLEVEKYNELDFKQESGDGKSIIVVLKDDDRYIENYRRVEKINEFLQSPESRSDDTKKAIAYRRQSETREIETTTQDLLKEGLIEADVYVLGEVLERGSNFKSRLDQAKKDVIDNNYRNLSYLTVVKTDNDITELFKDNKVTLVDDNIQAIEEVVNYIGTQAGMMNNISFAGVRQRFEKVPFGYKTSDVAWMVAKAFMDGKLKIYFNNEQITIQDAKDNPKDTAKYFTSKVNAPKLTIKPVKEITEKQKRDAQEYVEEVLDGKLTIMPNDTSEMIVESIKNKTISLITKLTSLLNKKYSADTPYPNHQLIEKGITRLRLVASKDSDTIFQYISENLPSYEDWYDDMEDHSVFEFYGDAQTVSDQQKIWNRSKSYLDRYNAAENFIQNEALTAIAQKIKENLENDNFGRAIPQLSKYNSEFAAEYNDVIQKLYDDVTAKVTDVQNTLIDRLREVNFPINIQEKLTKQIKDAFTQISNTAQSYSESAEANAYIRLYGLIGEIDSKRKELQIGINNTSTALAQQRKQELENEKPEEPGFVSHGDNSVSVELPDGMEPNDLKVIASTEVNITKSINIKGLIKEDSWHITSQDDLDKYIAELKTKLERELDNTDILNIDF